MVGGHPSFRDQAGTGLARGDQAVEIIRMQGDGFFAQDRLARMGRADRPIDMQGVGQRDIDRVNLGVGQKRVIAVMHAQPRRDGGKGFGAGRVTGS